MCLPVAHRGLDPLAEEALSLIYDFQILDESIGLILLNDCKDRCVVRSRGEGSREGSWKRIGVPSTQKESCLPTGHAYLYLCLQPSSEDLLHWGQLDGLFYFQTTICRLRGSSPLQAVWFDAQRATQLPCLLYQKQAEIFPYGDIPWPGDQVGSRYFYQQACLGLLGAGDLGRVAAHEGL